MGLNNYFSDKYLMTSDSIPTEGSFEVGDIVVNTGENISEEPFWICTESGTPGVWQSINVKSTTKMVSFKNKVVLTEATDTVNIGIDSFNIEKDTLIVFINDAYAYEHVDYVIDGTNIKTLGNKIWNEGLIEDFIFEFIVFKSILCIDESGILLLDQIPNGTLTINKFSQDIQEKLDFATTDLNVYQKHTEQKLPTNDKTIVGAINELFQNVDSGKGLIAAAIDNENITKNSTFEAMRNAILGLKRSTDNEAEAKEILYDMMIEDGYTMASMDMTTEELIKLLDSSQIEVAEIKKIACGGCHVFVLKTDGSLYACGRNNYGQLGLGDTTNRNTFTQVTTNVDYDVKDVVCGTYYSAIIKNDGSLYTCGINDQYQLGLNHTFDKSTFTKVTINADNVEQVACGSDHTLILKKDGTLWACGQNHSGSLAGLGASKINFGQITSNVSNVKKIGASYDYSMMLKNDGTLWACGSDEYWQIGVGSSSSYIHSSFTKTATDVKDFVCGYVHSVILKNDGTVWACGRTSSGQLGLGSTSDHKEIYTQIATDVKQIAGDNNQTFIIKNDGTLWACGMNGESQLGLGTVSNSVTKFTQVTTNISNDIKQLVAGSMLTYVLKNDGSIWACGDNSYGELGLGDSADRTTFTQLAPIGDIMEEYEFDQLRLYYYLSNKGLPVTEDMDVGSMLDLMVTGAINNQLNSGISNLKIILADEGVEVTEDDNLSSLVTKVDIEFDEKSNRLHDLMLDNGFEVNNNMNMNDLLNLLETKGMGKSPVKQIACGDGHTAILKEDGTLWMSGSNGYGQLLLGHKRTKFSFLLAATDVDQVACGNQHTLILKKDGTLWGIGYNAYCPLGTGSADSPTELTQIITNINNDVKEIYSTLYQTFIVKKDGTLWTAGYNNYGQLGIGSSSYAYSFAEVPGMTNVKQVACGTYHTMVLKEDGTVWACGWNSKGELGLNDTTNRNTFTQVTENVSDVKKIICSNMSTLMLKNDGTLWGTGDNSYSQLGFSNTSAKKFTQISSISDVLDASMGSHFTYVIKNDHTLWSRGYKYVGQLGLGSSGEGKIISFTQVTENVSNDAKCVVCGEDYAILLKTDGEVYGTGCSTSGEIGTGGNVNLSVFEKANI